LVVSELAMTGYFDMVNMYPCESKEEAELLALTQARGIGGDDIDLDFENGECDDALSDCGSEQYFRRIYPVHM